jgi:hypothetical protein
MALGVAEGARVQRPTRALWVREQRTALGPKSGDALLELCRSHEIGLLFVAAPELKAEAHKKWRQFLSRAHERGIRVHALAGEAAWALAQEAASGKSGRNASLPLGAGRSLALKHVGQVIAYNRKVEPSERFDGVQHDVPVWNTGEYAEAEGAARGTMLADFVEQLWGCAQFLRTLGKITGQIGDEQMVFGTSIPAGLDERTTWGKAGQYKEATLPASQQVLRTAHYTVVMAGVDTTEGILAVVTDHVRFAAKMGRKAFVGISTTPVGDAGASATLGDGSRAAADTVLAEVFARLSSEPGFAGIAIDGHATYASMKP